MHKKTQGFLKNRRVCVTGADGFVGSWLTRALVERGAQVCVLVHTTSGVSSPILRQMAPRIRIVRGDILRYAPLRRFFMRYKPNIVFHLAAQALVGQALENPRGTFEVNARGSWNVLEALRTLTVSPRIILASSVKVYESPNPQTHTRSPYALSRYVADEIALLYARTYRMPIAIARFTNIYGGGDLHLDRLIPYSICAWLRGVPPIIRSHPQQACRLLYITDAIDAYLVLAERLLRPSVRGNIFDFSTSRTATLKQVLRYVARLSGLPTVMPKYISNKAPDPETPRRSYRIAASVLGWSPHVTLERGLTETAKWYKEHLP